MLPSQRAQACIAPKAHSSHPRLLLSTRGGSGDVDAERRGRRWDTELQMLQSSIFMFVVAKTGTHHHFLAFLTKTDLTHSYTSCAASPPHPPELNCSPSSNGAVPDTSWAFQQASQLCFLKKMCSLWNKSDA